MMLMPTAPALKSRVGGLGRSAPFIPQVRLTRFLREALSPPFFVHVSVGDLMMRGAVARPLGAVPAEADRQSASGGRPAARRAGQLVEADIQRCRLGKLHLRGALARPILLHRAAGGARVAGAAAGVVLFAVGSMTGT